MALTRRSGPRRGIFRPSLESQIGLSERLGAYWVLQLDSLKASFGRICETPIASLLTILVVAIALALPANFHALIQNARQPIEALETTSQISLFLKPELGNEVGRKVAEQLRQRPGIGGATLVSKEDGLKELTAYSGFGEALEALKDNPLPVVVIVQPARTDADAVAALLAELRHLPEADKVQFDSEWLEKLRSLLAIAQRSTLAFSVLLGFGVLFIVGNTIRLELQNRREEIAVAKLLGATNHFIRRPFVHAGFWYALLGAVLAWMLANLLVLGVRAPVNQLAELYGSSYRLAFMGLADTVVLLGSAVLLGVTGAWIVVAYFLLEIEPE